MNIVPQNHWDKSYDNYIVKEAPDDDTISLLIKTQIPVAEPGQQAFEIGCYPARYLSILGKLGYVLNGVDATPNVISLKDALDKLGYKTGRFEHKSFEDAEKVKYDVVASFGFIEHFINWRDVIKSHLDFLKSNGHLIIATPNFKGLFQYVYHKTLDNENLKRHVVNSMSPQEWKDLLEQSGLEIISFGYIGFEFWDETPQKRILQRVLKRLIISLANFVHKLRPNHSSVASFCYVVAKSK